MSVICERGLLNLVEVSPHFLKPYSGHYLLALSTKTTWRAPPHERFLVLHEQPLFRKALNLRDCKHAFSFCPHQCSWQVWQAPASQVKVYCCVLWRQGLQEGLRGCTQSPCEQLRGSAALCWEMQAEPRQEAVLEEKLDLPVCSGLVSTLQEPPVRKQKLWYRLKADTLLQSTPQHHCWKQARIKGCSCRRCLGAYEQPQPASLALASQPSPPHAGAGFLHMALLHFHLLFSQPAMLSQQPSGRRAAHLSHHIGKEPMCRATTQPTPSHRSAHGRTEISLQGPQPPPRSLFLGSLLHATKPVLALQTSGRV